MNEDIEKKINEMYAWFQERQRQFVPYPVDEASKNALQAVLKLGAGSSDLTDTISIGAGGGSADVPKAYAGSIVIQVNGENYEIPYL